MCNWCEIIARQYAAAGRVLAGQVPAQRLARVTWQSEGRVREVVSERELNPHGCDLRLH